MNIEVLNARARSLRSNELAQQAAAAEKPTLDDLKDYLSYRLDRKNQNGDETRGYTHSGSTNVPSAAPAIEPEGSALDNLGRAYLSLGESKRAIAHYTEALAAEIGEQSADGDIEQLRTPDRASVASSRPSPSPRTPSESSRRPPSSQTSIMVPSPSRPREPVQRTYVTRDARVAGQYGPLASSSPSSQSYHV